MSLISLRVKASAPRGLARLLTVCPLLSSLDLLPQPSPCSFCSSRANLLLLFLHALTQGFCTALPLPGKLLLQINCLAHSLTSPGLYSNVTSQGGLPWRPYFKFHLHFTYTRPSTLCPFPAFFFPWHLSPSNITIYCFYC